MQDLMIAIQQILTKREYALWYMDYCGWTQQEIALEYGVSQQAISRRLKKITKKLKKRV